MDPRYIYIYIAQLIVLSSRTVICFKALVFYVCRDKNYVLKLTKKIIYGSKDYKKYTNLIASLRVAGSNFLDTATSYIQQNWTASPISWVKCNTDCDENQSGPEEDD